MVYDRYNPLKIMTKCIGIVVSITRGQHYISKHRDPINNSQWSHVDATSTTIHTAGQAIRETQPASVLYRKKNKKIFYTV